MNKIGISSFINTSSYNTLEKIIAQNVQQKKKWNAKNGNAKWVRIWKWDGEKNKEIQKWKEGEYEEEEK